MFFETFAPPALPRRPKIHSISGPADVTELVHFDECWGQVGPLYLPTATTSCSSGIVWRRLVVVEEGICAAASRKENAKERVIE